MRVIDDPQATVTAAQLESACRWFNWTLFRLKSHAWFSKRRVRLWIHDQFLIEPRDHSQ